MSILKEILSGHSTSSALLICDTTDSNGNLILGEFVNKLSRNGTKIIVLNFDGTNHSFDHIQNVTSIPVIRNHSSWIKPAAVKTIISTLLPTGSKYAVIIDSLDNALLKFEVDDFYRQLHTLIKNEDVVQLICHLQKEIADPEDINYLKGLFSTIISIEPQSANMKHPAYNLQHSKPNGKFFTEKRIFYEDVEGNFKIQPLASSEELKPAAPSEQPTQNVHDSFSTFRHGLNAEEQKARESLILPYQRMTLDGLPPRGQGKIEYEPEEDDEWDEEEDPDDDLEI